MIHYDDRYLIEIKVYKYCNICNIAIFYIVTERVRKSRTSRDRASGHTVSWCRALFVVESKFHQGERVHVELQQRRIRAYHQWATWGCEYRSHKLYHFSVRGSCARLCWACKGRRWWDRQYCPRCVPEEVNSAMYATMTTNSSVRSEDAYEALQNLDESILFGRQLVVKSSG